MMADRCEMWGTKSELWRTFSNEYQFRNSKCLSWMYSARTPLVRVYAQYWHNTVDFVPALRAKSVPNSGMNFWKRPWPSKATQHRPTESISTSDCIHYIMPYILRKPSYDLWTILSSSYDAVATYLELKICYKMRLSPISPKYYNYTLATYFCNCPMWSFWSFLFILLNVSSIFLDSAISSPAGCLWNIDFSCLEMVELPFVLICPLLVRRQIFLNIHEFFPFYLLLHS